MTRTIEDYARHDGDCKSWRCNQRPAPVPNTTFGWCGATRDSEIHYVGTVDSHAFEPHPCSCGLDALLSVAPSPPEPVAHYWTPDPTKRFCVICGDNGIGSVWGIHRFQIQPGDPDFKATSPRVPQEEE
jgi:hypothetical protein